MLQLLTVCCWLGFLFMLALLELFKDLNNGTYSMDLTVMFGVFAVMFLVSAILLSLRLRLDGRR